jgi:hypothetical protein
VGMDGAVSWVDFDREAVEGEYDFEVEAGSTQPRNETQRRQQALQLANVVAPYVGVPGGINPTTLLTYILREGFGIKNPQTFILPAAPAVQVDADGNPIAQDPGAVPPQGADPAAAAVAGGLTSPEAGPGAIPPEALTALQNLPPQ